MDDQVSVSVGQGIGNGSDNPSGLWPCHLVALHPPAQVGTVKVVGYEEHLSFMHANIVHRHDAGVPEAGKLPRLLQELIARDTLSRRRGVQHLDGHGPVELSIMAEIHRAEAAGPQQAPHFISAEGRRQS